MVVNLIWPYKRNKIVGEMGVDLTVWNQRHKQSMRLCLLKNDESDYQVKSCRRHNYVVIWAAGSFPLRWLLHLLYCVNSWSTRLKTCVPRKFTVQFTIPKADDFKDFAPCNCVPGNISNTQIDVGPCFFHFVPFIYDLESSPRKRIK